MNAASNILRSASRMQTSRMPQAGNPVIIITEMERRILFNVLRYIHDGTFESGDVIDFDATLGYVYVKYGQSVRVYKFSYSGGIVAYAGRYVNLAAFAAKGGVA